MNFRYLRNWHKWTIGGVLGALLPIAGTLATSTNPKIAGAASVFVSILGAAVGMGLVKMPAPTTGDGGAK